MLHLSTQKKEEKNKEKNKWHKINRAQWRRHELSHTRETRGVSHCGLAIYIKKYLKAKEELWKLKYFTMQKYT